MEKILVVDNEKSMREILSIALRKEGYFIETADDGDTALKILSKENFDLILTDVKMPRMNGLTLLHEAKTLSPETIIIMMTAYASTETAVGAMKEGAYDYLTKPFQLEEVKLIIQNALERRRLRRENLQLKQALKGRSDFSQILGKSQAMQGVLEKVQKVADQRANILILGESGTGKELIARAIHFNSSRKDSPFVTVNCGALPEPLLESELFGHMKGSFTGAISNKEGLFEVAHEGSIFLDEIGDAPLSIQVKLLRVLQEKEFRRVGGTKDIHVDVRIIAATNQDLVKLISEGKFREDLFYRLDVIPIVIPPLREHLEDIPILIDAFIKRFNLELGKEITGIENEALRGLMRRDWKGNVRELENCLERAVALSTEKILTASDLGGVEVPTKAEGLFLSSFPSIPELGLDLEASIGRLEKELLIKALEETNGVQTEAAKRLNISFRSFRYRVQKHGIDPSHTRKD
jgi:two-component system response regulator PilR (NtrC family)